MTNKNSGTVTVSALSGLAILIIAIALATLMKQVGTLELLSKSSTKPMPRKPRIHRTCSLQFAPSLPPPLVFSTRPSHPPAASRLPQRLRRERPPQLRLARAAAVVDGAVWVEEA